MYWQYFSLWYNFGFLKVVICDSALCNIVQWGIRLCHLWYSAESNFVLCDTSLGPVLCCVIQHWVQFCACDTALGLILCCVILRRIWLCTVWYSTGSSYMLRDTSLCLVLCCVIEHWVQFCAVWYWYIRAPIESPCCMWRRRRDLVRVELDWLGMTTD